MQSEPRPERYTAFSFGSIVENWAARGEPNVFHAPVSGPVRRKRATAIKNLWWRDTYNG